MTIVDGCVDAARAGLRPDRQLYVDEWADEYRYLSEIASAEAGRYRTARTPYVKEIMRTLSPWHPAIRVVVVGGAQVGKTEIGNNWIGFTIHRDPGPMLMVQPTVEVAERVSKQRIAPMIESTPVLRERVSEARTRDSSNTIRAKEFPGGLLLITGANSSAGVRSAPIRKLFMDEVDEYPGDLEGQGDPISLAEKRTTTFARKKIYMASTPTVRNVSRIEREFKHSNQQRYFIPCPHCGHRDFLTWSGYADFLRHEDGGHHRIEWSPGSPETAHMVCGGCGEDVEERHKTDMLARGEWRATAEGDGRTAGFHVSGLYSPLGWKSWRECAEEFISAKNDRFKLKAWVNTVLAETFEEEGSAVETHVLKKRLEVYKAEVPDGVGAITISVDTQGNRLEAIARGYGQDEESWLIAFTQIMGDPARGEVWRELDKFILQEFTTESGKKMRAECAVIDSGGLHTEAVYRYVAARANRSIYAIKGGTQRGRPIVERPSTTSRYHIPLFTLCVDTGKDMVLSRLMIGQPGPGYMHLPHWLDDEYIDQLTAERAVFKYVKGRGSVREWEKIRDRNEAFDLEVYALAALYIRGPAFVKNLGQAAKRVSTRLTTASEQPQVGVAIATKAPVPKKPGKSWVKDF